MKNYYVSKFEEGLYAAIAVACLVGIFLGLCICLSGCSNTKKLRSTHKEAVDSARVVTTASTVSTFNTEYADTTATTDSSSLSGDFDTYDTSSQVIETDDIRVVAKKNNATGKLSVKVTAKPKTVVLKVNKTSGSTGTYQTKDSGILAKTVSESVSKKEKSLPWYSWAIGGLVFLIILVAIYYYFRSKKVI